MNKYLFAALGLLTLAGCQHTETMTHTAATEATPETHKQQRVRTVKHEVPDMASMRLGTVLAAQPPEVRERYRYRNPQATLEFFGIQPGMTVIEALPGGGWYSKILIDYLGPDGHLVGADYAKSMFPKFGFFSDEFIAAKETWVEDWTAGAREWYGDRGAQVSAFTFGALPPKLRGQADAVLMIRALHNLARFENDGGYMTMALRDAYDALRPGGTLGVVQHWWPDELEYVPTNGYLHRNFVIAQLEKAGFEYVASSPVNHNHRDQPAADDIVWRLPPTLITSRDDPDLRARMNAIGESNRMTLKFRKPR